MPDEVAALAAQLPHAIAAFGRPEFAPAVLDVERSWLPAGALAVALLMVQPLERLPEAAASLGPAACHVCHLALHIVVSNCHAPLSKADHPITRAGLLCCCPGYAKMQFECVRGPMVMQLGGIVQILAQLRQLACAQASLRNSCLMNFQKDDQKDDHTKASWSTRWCTWYAGSRLV